MTSGDLHEALQNTYPAPNFTYLKEVRDATGFDSVRSADALAIGMYRSCGRLIHGFELKVSRSDWLRELKNAAKAESIMRYCHHWSLIVPDPSIVHDGELPPTWGLGVANQVRKNAPLKIKWVIKPPLNEPQPPSMVFLSALIYAARKVDGKEQTVLLNKRYEEGRQAGLGETKRQMADFSRLSEIVATFESTSGVSLSRYDSIATTEKKGLAFKEWLHLEKDVAAHRSNLQQLKEQADRIAASITRTLQPLEAAAQL